MISRSAECVGDISALGRDFYSVAGRFGLMKNWLWQISETSVLASVAPPSGKSYTALGGRLWVCKPLKQRLLPPTTLVVVDNFELTQE